MMNTMDEYEADLWHQAEFAATGRRPSQKPSNRLKKARASLFDDVDFPEHLVQQPQTTKLVRGRPVKIYKDTRPGDLNERENIRHIAEVSGLGYSNEIIEQHLRRSTTDESTEERREMPNIAFVVSDSSSSSSSKSRSKGRKKCRSPDELYEDSRNDLQLDQKNFPSLK